VVVKLALILAFLVAVLPFAHLDRLAAATPLPAPVTFAQAMIIFIFGFSGFERAAMVAGEVAIVLFSLNRYHE